MTKYFQNEQSPLKNFWTYRTAIAKLDRGQKPKYVFIRGVACFYKAILCGTTTSSFLRKYTIHSVAVALMMPWKICICYCSTVWLNPRWPPTKVQSSLPIHDPDLELTPNSCKKVITFRDFSSARAHWSRGLSATATAIPSLESTTGVAAVVFLPSLSRVHITNCPWWLITPQHWDLGLILFPFFTVAETQYRMSLRNQTPFFSRKRSVHIA